MKNAKRRENGMQYVLFNPQAGNGSGAQQARALDARFPEETFSYTDMTTISDYAAWLGTLPADASLIIAGGDGTLNRFLNDTDGMALPEQLYYFATGSGNDFLHDLGLEKGADPVPVAQYLRDLPTVTVNGKHWRFLNGIGYGIDGYCCEVGDALRGKSDKPVNYTAIAIKGLLFYFHPANAEVTVDGKTKRYRRVWLAPTMNGRFYGGGMMVTPDQHRGNAEGKVSVCVMHGSGKIKTLAVFPSIFKGGHVKHTEMVEILTGHDIEVRFDRPCALQIDGETIRNVTSYSVRTGVPARV
jgi:diacylglycerol kinase (ATP)